jgi:hypothetical protein
VGAFLAVLAALSAAVVARRRWRGRLPARAVIISPAESTVVARDGAVRSVQTAELTMDERDYQRMWNAAHLEDLARTYWRFLTRVTLGLIRVIYGENERSVVLLAKPLTLLRFEAPEYVLEPDAGTVRWRIRDGLLVARAGRGCGYLALDVRHLSSDPNLHREKIRIEVAVANFYPAIAVGFSVPVYEATQSSIHVLVTHAFLRSLARLDLARSRVGRFAAQRASGIAAGRAIARAMVHRQPAPQQGSAVADSGESSELGPVVPGGDPPDGPGS